MKLLDERGIGTVWSICKEKFALAGHTHNYAGSGSPGGSANSAIGVVDYNQTSKTIQIGYSGAGITGDQIKYIAGYTDGSGNVNAKIKDVSKDALRAWLGLGSLAYSSSSIPTNLSQLNNDKGFVTGSVSGNTVTINGASTTWTNTWRGIQDNLTSTSTYESLSANQGRVLKGLIDGKANSSHTHNYLPLSGGTLTGDLLFSNSGTTFRQIRGTCGDNDFWRIGGGATGNNAGYMEIATADDGTEPIYVRQYSGTFSAITRTATLLDGSGNTSFPGTVAAAKFKGALEGNASTASNAATVNGHTVNSNVPANAKFTDTNTWRPIQDNLTSSSTSDSLSANQGRVLKGLIDSKANSSDLSSYSQKSETIKSIRIEKNGYTQGDSKLVQVLHVFKANGEGDYLQMYNADSNINGLMSYQDKIKLDGIASGANNYSLPTATETTLGGIKVDFIPKDGNCRFKVQRDINGNANTFIPGLKYGDDECLSGVQVSGDSHTSVTYTGNGVTFNDQYGQKIGNIKFGGNDGYFALKSDIPDVSNLCRFNFVNSISECRSDRINFFLRCSDYIIRLDPFDSYPDGTILLITTDNNAADIEHRSGRWYSDGDNVSTNYSCNTYKEEINLITKNNGTVHHYKFN